jgi:hypothetical protein
LDCVRRFALAAADEGTGRGVAIARHETVDDGGAEVAVALNREQVTAAVHALERTPGIGRRRSRTRSVTRSDR